MSCFEHLHWSARTDVGCIRKNNEDNFGTFPRSGVFLVADGMGGGDDGEVASEAAVEAVETFCGKHPQPENAVWRRSEWLDGIERAVHAAGVEIFERTQRLKLRRGCGSTFVAAVFDGAKPAEATAVHAGDSRIYLLSHGKLNRITRDHSVEEMYKGKIPEKMRGMILRAVGIQATVEFERTPFAVAAGDRLLICSDGLSRMVSDANIRKLLGSGTHEQACEALLKAALDAGGKDNVTVIVIEIGELPAPLPSRSISNPDNSNPESDSDGDTADTERDTSDTDERPPPPPPAHETFFSKIFRMFGK